MFKGTFGSEPGHLRGSYIVQADEDAGDKNSMTGPLVMDSIRKEVADLAVCTADRYGPQGKVPEDNSALLKMKEHIHNATARKGD